MTKNACPQHADEVAAGKRFEFGANWLRFLSSVDQAKMNESARSLQRMLGTDSLEGKTFLDIGSGSGLFSLAARTIGAKVYSFDYDPESVTCTRELKRRYRNGDADWEIAEGSVLDQRYMESLDRYDVVYSWGVLHHTGAVWTALENAMARVKPRGLLFIALYNDEGPISKYWLAVKALYNRFPWMRWPLRVLYAPYFVGLGWAVSKWRRFRGKRSRRGMTLWYDMFDWLGGYPFEVVSPKEMNAFAAARKFELINHYYVGRGSGCNEYVYRRVS